MAKIIDVTLFNGEYGLWDIRYNILKDFVREFIVCEAPTTFSGKPKPLYFEKIKDKYPNVKYFVINENYTAEEIKQAEESPNTKGIGCWVHEFLQKESIKKALTHLKDDDVVFISDCDEIWNPHFGLLNLASAFYRKLSQTVYVYFLNNKSNEEWYGTFVANYGNIKNECLNHLRTSGYAKTDNNGWHFTSLKDGLRRKLTDSYTKESYATDEVMNNLEENIKNNKDFLGRGFTFRTDESELPQYLKENKSKYAGLFK